jgi:hypothetical protein
MHRLLRGRDRQHVRRNQEARVPLTALFEQVACCPRRPRASVEVVAQAGVEIGMRAFSITISRARCWRQAAQVGQACSVTMISTSCSVWSTCETIGTMVKWRCSHDRRRQKNDR